MVGIPQPTPAVRDPSNQLPGSDPQIGIDRPPALADHHGEVPHPCDAALSQDRGAIDAAYALLGSNAVHPHQAIGHTASHIAAMP